MAARIGRARWVILLFLIAACDGDACLDVGCNENLALAVGGIADVAGLTGSVVVGDVAFVVDCTNGAPNVTCEGTGITLYVGRAPDAGRADWSLTGLDADGGTVAGEGAFTPTWAKGEYWDAECNPECWFGTGEVELLPTP